VRGKEGKGGRSEGVRWQREGGRSKGVGREREGEIIIEKGMKGRK
jgi:hypothetical protein